MDIQSFIQSGLLEAYVLGQCTPEERAQVERMVAAHPEVRTELDAIQASLETYASAHAVPPPDGMKSRIMDRIAQETPNVAAPRPHNQTLRIFQVISFLLAALCSFLFLSQKELGQENKVLKQRADSLQVQLIACNNDAQKPDPIAELLCDPRTQRILVSDGKGIGTLVYYNPQLKRMAYDPYSLPAANPGTHYQFWAIVDGKPLSMGMKAANMCESIHTVENAAAFAISEEDKPEGNPAPSKVLAIGKAG